MLINGSNFQIGATLTFHDPQNNVYAGRTTGVVSSSQLSGTFNNRNTPGTWTVLVTNPDNQTSNIWSFTVNVTTVPSTPTGLSPGGSSQPGPTVTTLTPTLTWNASAGATQYSVALSQVGGGSVLAQNVSTTSITSPTLVNGATYLWAVPASNSAGSSPTSTVVYFTVNVIPFIRSLSPSSYPANTTSQAMSINGSSFESGATLTFHDPQNHVYFGRPTTFVSSSQLNAPFNNGNDPGTWTVFVTNPSGQTSNTGVLPYID